MKKKIWKLKEVKNLFKLPFFELLFQAQKVHRLNFNPQEIQISVLLSIKTGACPEDCKYCPQSSRYKTGLKNQPLMKFEEVIKSAKKAKKSGSTRFCMGAAWRNPHDRDMPYLENILKKIKSLGMETCMTLGKLNKDQAFKLAKAGLDYYNHNLDTSSKFYKKIITTRTYQDRISTIKNVQKAGMKVCSGGIIGLGENQEDRASLLLQLANLNKVPESVPINMLVRIKGTPFENNKKVESFDFIKTIAVARIMMPFSVIRLSAGREKMNEQMQALCFMAGANSIFYGCKLLTAQNPTEEKDKKLFKKLNLNPTTIKLNFKEKENKLLEDESEKFYNAAI